MIGLFLAASLIYNVLTSTINSYISVTETVYKQDSSSITTAQDNNSPGKESRVEDSQTALDYIEELKKLGFYKDEFDAYDLNVRNAVVRFQASHNLDVDGDFGEQSRAALKKRINDTNFAYPDTVSEVPTKNKWITINTSKKILTLYENGAAIKKYPIAVGTFSTPTPNGKFTIVIKVVNPAWGGGGYAQPVEGGSPNNPLGYRWLGISLNGGGDYGIHGNNSPYSIGTFASHGCIRMINPDVEELFSIIPAGTIVWIGTDEVLTGWGVLQNNYLSKK